VVSANGSRNAIVWLIETKVWNDYASTRPSVLRAYDAANVALELYNSEQNRARPRRRHRALHDSDDCRRSRLRQRQT